MTVASNTQDTMNLAQGVPTIAVGQSLKTARELMGKSVDEVAQHLRIRQPFLQALEDGRHKDLPGGAYAIGFLRTYAEFLGLDGEEMVRRFRAEAAGDLNPRSELVFPSPVSEGRIPGGAVLFLGLLLAGLAYGVWYFLSSRTTDVAEMVPPLPDRLASALSRPATVTGDAAKPADETKAEDAKTGDVPPSPDDSADKAEPTPDAQAVATAKDTEVVPPAEEDDAKTQPVAETPVTATPSNTPQADAGKLEAGKVEQPKAAPSVPPPAPAAKTATPAATPAATTPAPLPPADTTAPQPAAEAAATPAAAPVAEGKVIGQEHIDSRVQLKAALADCWVQVREMDGQLLLSRLLRKGDSYMVPNRPGLTLMVGNAGALEVLVDGKTGPSLGSSGQVRRDIKLDPDKLLGGN